MKILTLTILGCCLFISSTVLAQATLKPTIGINVSDVSKDPATGEAKGKVGWQIGAGLLLGEKLYLEPGLYFLQTSTEFTSENASDFNFKSQIKGLRIPVSIGYHLIGKEESVIDLRVFGGASTFIITDVDAGSLTKDDFKSPTWGIFAGAGLDVLIFFVDLKYEWSLTNVASVTDFDIGKRRSTFINAGVRLPL